MAKEDLILLTGGSEALGLQQVAAVLSRVLGRSIRYRRPDVLAFPRHLSAAGHPLAFGLVMTGVYTVARLGLAAGTSPDLERLLGRKPTWFEPRLSQGARGRPGLVAPRLSDEINCHC